MRAATQFLQAAKALEPTLKSALYNCFERAHATKAALYLATANNADDQRYPLVTSYGYSAAGRDAVDAKDAVVDALLKIKKPVIVNELSSDRLSEVMFRQQNERLMVILIFGRGRRMGSSIRSWSRCSWGIWRRFRSVAAATLGRRAPDSAAEGGRRYTSRA